MFSFNRCFGGCCSSSCCCCCCCCCSSSCSSSIFVRSLCPRNRTHLFSPKRTVSRVHDDAFLSVFLSFYKQRVFVRREVRVFARAGRGGGRSGLQEQHQEHVVTTNSTSTTINGTNKQRENRKQQQQQQQQQQQLKVEGVHAKTINNRDRPRYKTRLCNSFRQEGTCRFGSACLFAHSNEELRKTTTTSAVDLELQYDSNRGNIDRLID